MSTRHLESLFRPKSVAIIGASTRENSVGSVLAHNLFTSGFNGAILPVNPREKSVHGVLAYPSVDELPLNPDLAVIATPPNTIPDIIAALGRKRCHMAIIISAGFAELGETGRTLQEQIVLEASELGIRLIGPNCLGVMVPKIGLNASFVHIEPLAGDIACIAQSGAVLTSIVDWATPQSIGFSALVSLGGMSDVDFDDMIDYFAHDVHTRAILLYMEGVTDARRFISAARAASMVKPVVVVKGGKSRAAAKAVSSHTGALAGTDAVYDAAFRRAGVLRVNGIADLFNAAETIAMYPNSGGTNSTRRQGMTGLDMPHSDSIRIPENLTIVTNGGGIGIMATDALVAGGGHLTELSEETLAALNAVLPAIWSKANPIDIIGDAPPKRYRDAVAAVMDDSNTDAVLVLNCPTAIADCAKAARFVVDAIKGKNRLVLTSWVGGQASIEGRKVFLENRVPSFETPEDAVRAFLYMGQYKRNQAMLLDVNPSIPSNFKANKAIVRGIIDAMLADGREWVSEHETKQIFKAYGIPVTETVFVKTPLEAGAAYTKTFANSDHKTVVLKIESPDITHKSDAGGVALNLASAADVQAAAEKMLVRAKAVAPYAEIHGFVLQQMVKLPHAFELIIGMVDDALFGPVILFGAGGTAVEVLDDKALELPPVTTKLAAEMIKRTRIWKQLRGFRSVSAIDIHALSDVIVRISMLVSDFPEIAELDINPLLANAEQVIALDGRLRVAKPAQKPLGYGLKALNKNEYHSRLAIRPYPQELEKTVQLKDNSSYFLRPVRPDDVDMLQDLVSRMTPDDLRLRFLVPMKGLPRVMAARLCQIDYAREMAFVAIPEQLSLDSVMASSQTPPGYRGWQEEISGVGRIRLDQNEEEASFALLVRSDLQGKGLGLLLLSEILNYAKSRKLNSLTANILKENTLMLSLCGNLGFKIEEDPSNPQMVEVSLKLKKKSKTTVTSSN